MPRDAACRPANAPGDPWTAVGRPRRLSHTMAFALALGAVAGWLTGGVAAEPASSAGPAAVLRVADGTTVEGTLVRVTAEAVVIAVVGAERSIPVDSLRRVDVVGAEVEDASAVTVTCVDGGWLTGADFGLATEGGTATATLVRGDGQWRLPAEKVLRVEWTKRDAAPPSAPGPAPWQADLPEGADGDLLVVAGEPTTFVPCAIATVDPQAVTVVLDGETIPVKRAKVLGLVFLREAASAGVPAGAVSVAVAGGRFVARAVEWSAAGLVLDGGLHFPAASLRGIDYAAGRTVELAGLTPEKVEVEPFFGSLMKIDGVGAFFAPRPLPDGGLLVRPRTEVTYRIPPGGRRFHTRLLPALPRPTGGTVTLVVRVDDREVHRATISAADPGAAAAVDLDIAGGRRLTLVVEFGGPADPGFPLRFDAAAIDR